MWDGSGAGRSGQKNQQSGEVATEWRGSRERGGKPTRPRRAEQVAARLAADSPGGGATHTRRHRAEQEAARPAAARPPGKHGQIHFSSPLTVTVTINGRTKCVLCGPRLIY